MDNEHIRERFWTLRYLSAGSLGKEAEIGRYRTSWPLPHFSREPFSLIILARQNQQ